MYKVKNKINHLINSASQRISLSVVSGRPVSRPRLSGRRPPPGGLQGGQGDPQALHLPVRRG